MICGDVDILISTTGHCGVASGALMSNMFSSHNRSTCEFCPSNGVETVCHVLRERK